MTIAWMRIADGKVKSGEIARRIKATEKDIDQVVKELNNETEPPEETFLILEEEVNLRYPNSG